MPSKTVKKRNPIGEVESITGCSLCPLARHLYGDRYSCGANVSPVSLGKYPATEECRQAVTAFPDKYYQPSLLDLQEVDAERVCDQINLSVDILDDCLESGFVSPDETNTVEIVYKGIRIGYLKRKNSSYYCDRLQGLLSPDPYWVALHMIHPEFLYGVVEKILNKNKEVIPDYM